MSVVIIALLSLMIMLGISLFLHLLFWFCEFGEDK